MQAMVERSFTRAAFPGISFLLSRSIRYGRVRVDALSNAVSVGGAAYTAGVMYVLCIQQKTVFVLTYPHLAYIVLPIAAKTDGYFRRLSRKEEPEQGR
jgi:hypothetical protein